MFAGCQCSLPTVPVSVVSQQQAVGAVCRRRLSASCHSSRLSAHSADCPCQRRVTAAGCQCSLPTVSVVARKQKMRARDDLPSVPRSLFDCPQTITQRMERDGRLVKPNFFKPVKTQLQAVAGMNRATLEPLQDHPEWLIHEDWALLQVSSVMPLDIFITVELCCSVTKYC